MNKLLILLLFFIIFIFSHINHGNALSVKRTAASSSSSSSPIVGRRPQILSFIEPNTNIKVTLLGTMHYNPVSIDTARSVINTIGSAGKLSTVIVESCASRWKNSVKNDFIRNYILYNEMKSASDAADIYNAKLVLGDQDIKITNDRLKSTFVQGIKDLVNPITGWSSLYTDIKTTLYSTVIFPSTLSSSDSDSNDTAVGGDGRSEGSSYLTVSDFFDLPLLQSAPVSLVRYPLAILLKAPKLLIPIALVLFASTTFADHIDASTDILVAAPVTTTLVNQAIDVAESVLLSFLEICVLGRPMLIALLHERNQVLADSILNECISASSLSSASNGGVVKDEVVLVCGMAHVNGIKAILTNKKQ